MDDSGLESEDTGLSFYPLSYQSYDLGKIT